MGVVALRQSGLIYYDDFNSTTLDSRWEVLPNDTSRWSLSEVGGSLRLKHGIDPLYFFFTPLTNINQFVLDVKNNYNPTTEGDLGGIIVYADGDDYIEIEEYYDITAGTAESYPWLRLVRNYNKYSAYWSEDGKTWNLLGSAQFDRTAPKIGLYLKGETGEYMDIETIRIYSLPEIIVGNVTPGTEVTLLDSVGTEIETRVCRDHSSEVKFNVSQLSMPFIGKFLINDGVTIYQSPTDLEMWGGNIYDFEINVDLFYIDDLKPTPEEVHVSQGMEQFLGYINNKSFTYRDIKMIVKNNHSGTFNDVTISLVPYNNSDAYSRLVEIAHDDGGVPGVFGSGITFPTINSGESYEFWLRINRETEGAFFSSDVYFGLEVTSIYDV